jgi:adenylosuccinate synthase
MLFSTETATMTIGGIVLATAIVGANWGDEGKGKITDHLANTSDVVVRFQGGSNAGHTIINEHGKFALHLLPSGVFCRNVTNVIGNGVAVNVEELDKELKMLKNSGVPDPNLIISNRAQILMSYHILLDIYEEERLSSKKFGSTKSGIAPFYSDKFAKNGIQISEIFGNAENLKDRLKNIIEVKNVLIRHLYKKEEIHFQDIFDRLMYYKEILAPHVENTSDFLQNAVKQNKIILLEGQLGALKDTDFGIYPMVTSSNTIAGYASVGTGIPPYEIKEIIAVVKAYSSCVGSGDFVSELFGEEAETLRKLGGDCGEYGATTGRPRRVGWLDLVATRYGCKIQGATSVAFTVLDALGYLDEIKVCTGYEINGKITKDFPVPFELSYAKPIYEVFKGWECDIREILNYNDLPYECKKYIEFTENQIGVPIKIISNGPSRQSIIYRYTSNE